MRLQKEHVKQFINMKKLLAIIVLGLLFSGNAYAAKDKIFYISCSAKGYEYRSLSGKRSVETVVDEYKITIGKGDVLEGDRWPKTIHLVNTNAEIPGHFYLYRIPVHQNISYSNKIISFSNRYSSASESVASYYSTKISLISGTYNLDYEDEIFSTEAKDAVKYSATGKCAGMASVASYLQKNKLK